MRSLQFLSLRGLAAVCLMLVFPLTALAGSRSLEPIRFRAADWYEQPAWQIFAGDFNHDGKQDALLSIDEGARFFAGAGNGTFANGVTSTLGFSAAGVADFNRDGHADLYYARQPFGVSPGQGDGTFGNAYLPPIADGAKAVVAADFNGDTFLDIASAFANTQSVIVHFGNGAGGFTAGPTTSYSLAGSFGDMKAGDFDGDGRADLFLLSDSASLIAWNNGQGVFSQQANHTAKGSRVATGDVNGDGLADAVTMTGNQYETGKVEVFFGTGNRNTVPAAQFPTPPNPGGSVTIAQMDGTGGGDIVIGSVDVIVITHDGTSFRTPRAVAAKSTTGVAAADFDGDGKTDVLASQSYYPTILMAFLRGNGDGTLRGDPSFHGLMPSRYSASSVPSVSDLNADGKLDLIVVSAPAAVGGTFTLGVAYGNNTGGFAAPILTSWTPSYLVASAPVAGDMNGDGRPDLLFEGYDQATNVSRWQAFFLNPNGTFTDKGLHAGSTARVILRADLTGDGRLDVLDTNGMRYAGNANGTFGAAQPLGIPLRQNAEMADLNNDGLRDFITWGYLNVAGITCYLNNGNGTFTFASETTSVASVEGFADANGDGFPELFSLFGQMFRANGNGTFSDRPFYFPLADIPYPYHHRPWAADFDGDGKQDIAIPGVIYYGNGEVAFVDAARMTAVADIISTADFDGNGSPDVWMADNTSGRIVIVRTRLGTVGTVVPSFTSDTGASPSRYGDQISAEVGVAVDEIVAARGAVLVQVGSEPASIGLLDTAGRITVGVPIPIGTSTIKTTFTGDGYYAPATTSTTHTVLKAIPLVDLGVSGTTLEQGGVVRLCGKANPVDSGAPPTGTVTARKDGVVVGTFDATNRFCDHVVEIPNLPIGTHTFVGEYPGDEHYEALTVTQIVTITRFAAPMKLTVQEGPLFEGMLVSVTAAFPEDPGVTGTVTFTRNGYTASVPIANGKAVWTTSFPYGGGQVYATFAGNADYQPSSDNEYLYLYAMSMNDVPVLQLQGFTLGINFRIELRIPAVYGAIGYWIYRSIDGGPFGQAIWVDRGDFPLAYDWRPLNQSLAYTVMAVGETGNLSPMSARVVTSTHWFNDPTLVPNQTAVKALHVTQLQAAINGFRAAAGLPQATFAALAAGSPVSPATITTLRNTLAEARNALGRPITFTDPALTAGVTPIRTIHLKELRDGVR